MIKVIIIGGGFAGRAALSRLASGRKGLEIVLIDRKLTSDFLPALPDGIGRRVSLESLCLDLKSTVHKAGAIFVQDEVQKVDVNNRRVVTAKQTLSYDYLLIASGSETNFYGNTVFQQKSFTVDSAQDVEKIQAALAWDKVDHCLVIGGGYTGVEVATNLWKYFKRRKTSKKITILEKAPTLLGPLPAWMQQYVFGNLQNMGIEVLCGTSVAKMEGQDVLTSTGVRFQNPLIIWTAGVKTSEYIFQSDVPKKTQGRIPVDPFLRLNERCFVAGDAALFETQGIALRMAVQFALTQGRRAALNIERSILGRKLLPYKPVDLGYIIPMANNLSCGKLLCFDVAGICPFKNTWICGKLVCLNFRGRMATVLHYFMCLLRLPGFKNKFSILKALFQ